MEEEFSSENIEWKNKRKFDSSEKNSRKIDVKKNIEYEAKKKNSPAQTTPQRMSDLPKGLKKIRKKIKEAYDEEDEEDYISPFPHETDNTLLMALYDDEKKHLQQKNTIHTMNMQQEAGRMESIIYAENITKDLGLSGLDKNTINAQMQDKNISDAPIEKILKDDISRKTKRKISNLSKAETVTMLRGIARIRSMAAASDKSQLKMLEKMKISEILNAGEKNTEDQQVAELILKKSGRKDKKEASKLVQKNKLRSKNKNLKNKIPSSKSKDPELISRDKFRS